MHSCVEMHSCVDAVSLRTDTKNSVCGYGCERGCGVMIAFKSLLALIAVASVTVCGEDRKLGQGAGLVCMKMCVKVP
jgi:hypothetical protein